MTHSELADALYGFSHSMKTLADQVDRLQAMPEPDHRYITPRDILRGRAKLSTIAIAPGYRDATLVVNMLENDQTLEVCLSVKDSLWLHQELANMIEIAGDKPLGEGDR